jgi:Sec-independent protein translocase protein TatA
MGLGTDIVFLLGLALVFLGPRQMHALLRNVARMKAEFDRASREIRTQIESELELKSKG